MKIKLSVGLGIVAGLLAVSCGSNSAPFLKSEGATVGLGYTATVGAQSDLYDIVYTDPSYLVAVKHAIVQSANTAVEQKAAAFSILDLKPSLTQFRNSQYKSMSSGGKITTNTNAIAAYSVALKMNLAASDTAGAISLTTETVRRTMGEFGQNSITESKTIFNDTNKILTIARIFPVSEDVYYVDEWISATVIADKTKLETWTKPESALQIVRYMAAKKAIEKKYTHFILLNKSDAKFAVSSSNSQYTGGITAFEFNFGGFVKLQNGGDTAIDALTELSNTTQWIKENK